MKTGDQVSFEVGRRIVTGTASGFYAHGTKVAVETPEGEYVLPLTSVIRA